MVTRVSGAQQAQQDNVRNLPTGKKSPFDDGTAFRKDCMSAAAKGAKVAAFIAPIAITLAVINVASSYAAKS